MRSRKNKTKNEYTHTLNTKLRQKNTGRRVVANKKIGWKEIEREREKEKENQRLKL
jgi:hypothetical protein